MVAYYFLCQFIAHNALQLQDVADRQCGRANGLLSFLIPEQTVSRPEHRAQRSEHGAQPVAAVERRVLPGYHGLIHYIMQPLRVFLLP